MTFPINVNIPNAPNDPADDQPLMKQNFANISGFLSVDHVPPGVSGPGAFTAGKHAQVELPVKATNFPKLVGQGTLFSKNVTYTGIPGTFEELFWQYGTALTAGPLQVTNALGSGPGNNGYTGLFNGLILQWGKGTTTGTITNYSFAAPNIPFPNAIFTVYITPVTGVLASNQSMNINGKATTGFIVNSAPGYATGTDFYWLALGN